MFKPPMRWGTRGGSRTAGPELHKRLIEQDAADARLGKYPYYFFEKCWDEGYLGMRERNPVNINPYIGFNKPAHKKIGTQAKVCMTKLLSEFLQLTPL